MSSDLAPPSEPLRPEFPLALEGTRLVLYPGSAQELRARWHLHSNDFMSYGAAFPVADGRPEAVLRLRRLRDGEGSETVQEIRLQRSSIGGSGDLVFGVGDDHAQFEAELGLTNEAGGWLSLVRSNRLQHAAGIELEGVDWEVVRAARAALLPPATPTLAAAGSDVLQRSGGASDGLADGERLGHPSAASPLDGRHGPASEGAASPQETGADASEPAAEENATLAAFPIPTLVYGKPVTRGTELVVEAVLHIRGWGTPNSQVDLFGHRYRIGPGGRFELVLKVDDPKLLKAALIQHPPPELGSQRED